MKRAQQGDTHIPKIWNLLYDRHAALIAALAGDS